MEEMTEGRARRSQSRRSSILKSTRFPLEEMNTNTDETETRTIGGKKCRKSVGRRVSFAEKPQIKEFEKPSCWNQGLQNANEVNIFGVLAQNCEPQRQDGFNQGIQFMQFNEAERRVNQQKAQNARRQKRKSFDIHDYIEEYESNESTNEIEDNNIDAGNVNKSFHLNKTTLFDDENMDFTCQQPLPFGGDESCVSQDGGTDAFSKNFVLDGNNAAFPRDLDDEESVNWYRAMIEKANTQEIMSQTSGKINLPVSQMELNENRDGNKSIFNSENWYREMLEAADKRFNKNASLYECISAPEGMDLQTNQPVLKNANRGNENPRGMFYDSIIPTLLQERSAKDARFEAGIAREAFRDSVIPFLMQQNAQESGLMKKTTDNQIADGARENQREEMVPLSSTVVIGKNREGSAFHVPPSKRAKLSTNTNNEDKENQIDGSSVCHSAHSVIHIPNSGIKVGHESVRFDCKENVLPYVMGRNETMSKMPQGLAFNEDKENNAEFIFQNGQEICRVNASYSALQQNENAQRTALDTVHKEERPLQSREGISETEQNSMHGGKEYEMLRAPGEACSLPLSPKANAETQMLKQDGGFLVHNVEMLQVENWQQANISELNHRRSVTENDKEVFATGNNTEQAFGQEERWMEDKENHFQSVNERKDSAYQYMQQSVGMEDRERHTKGESEPPSNVRATNRWNGLNKDNEAHSLYCEVEPKEAIERGLAMRNRLNATQPALNSSSKVARDLRSNQSVSCEMQDKIRSAKDCDLDLREKLSMSQPALYHNSRAFLSHDKENLQRPEPVQAAGHHTICGPSTSVSAQGLNLTFSNEPQQKDAEVQGDTITYLSGQGRNNEDRKKQSGPDKECAAPSNEHSNASKAHPIISMEHAVRGKEPSFLDKEYSIRDNDNYIPTKEHSTSCSKVSIPSTENIKGKESASFQGSEKELQNEKSRILKSQHVNVTQNVDPAKGDSTELQSKPNSERANAVNSFHAQGNPFEQQNKKFVLSDAEQRMAQIEVSREIQGKTAAEDNGRNDERKVNDVVTEKPTNKDTVKDDGTFVLSPELEFLRRRSETFYVPKKDPNAFQNVGTKIAGSLETVKESNTALNKMKETFVIPKMQYNTSPVAEGTVQPRFSIGDIKRKAKDRMSWVSREKMILASTPLHPSLGHHINTVEEESFNLLEVTNYEKVEDTDAVNVEKTVTENVDGKLGIALNRCEDKENFTSERTVPFGRTVPPERTVVEMEQHEDEKMDEKVIPVEPVYDRATGKLQEVGNNEAKDETVVQDPNVNHEEDLLLMEQEQAYQDYITALKKKNVEMQIKLAELNKKLEQNQKQVTVMEEVMKELIIEQKDVEKIRTEIQEKEQSLNEKEAAVERSEGRNKDLKRQLEMIKERENEAIANKEILDEKAKVKKNEEKEKEKTWMLLYNTAKRFLPWFLATWSRSHFVFKMFKFELVIEFEEVDENLFDTCNALKWEKKIKDIKFGTSADGCNARSIFLASRIQRHLIPNVLMQKYKTTKNINKLLHEVSLVLMAHKDLYKDINSVYIHNGLKIVDCNTLETKFSSPPHILFTEFCIRCKINDDDAMPHLELSLHHLFAKDRTDMFLGVVNKTKERPMMFSEAVLNVKEIVTEAAREYLSTKLN